LRPDAVFVLPFLLVLIIRRNHNMIKLFSWRRRKRLLDRPFKHLLFKGMEWISLLTAEKLPSI
jgi:hypothetical protein